MGSRRVATGEFNRRYATKTTPRAEALIGDLSIGVSAPKILWSAALVLAPVSPRPVSRRVGQVPGVTIVPGDGPPLLNDPSRVPSGL